MWTSLALHTPPTSLLTVWAVLDLWFYYGALPFFAMRFGVSHDACIVFGIFEVGSI